MSSCKFKKNSFKSLTLKLLKTTRIDFKLLTVIIIFVKKVIGMAKSVVSMLRNHMSRVSNDFC